MQTDYSRRDNIAISHAPISPLPPLPPSITPLARKFIQPDGTAHEIELLQTKNQPIDQISQQLLYEKVTIDHEDFYILISSVKKFTSESNLVTSDKIREYFSTKHSQTTSKSTLAIKSNQEQQTNRVIETVQRHFIQMAIDAERLKQGQFLEKHYGRFRFTIIRTGTTGYEISTQGKKIGKGSLKTAYISVPIITDKLPQVEYSTKDSIYDSKTAERRTELEFNIYTAIREKMNANQQKYLLHQTKYTSPSGQSKIIAEKCDGDLLLVKNTLSLQEKVTLAIQGAQVLASVHAIGYVHFDIKPANLLVKTNKETLQKEIRLSDFDLTRKANQLGGCRGTPSFLAPELAALRKKVKILYQPSMDVFSYGVTLYELFPLPNQQNKHLVHWRPTNREHEESMIKVCQEKLRTTKDPIYELIADCIDYDPTKRPSMEEVAQRLETLASSSPIPPTENII